MEDEMKMGVHQAEGQYCYLEALQCQEDSVHAVSEFHGAIEKNVSGIAVAAEMPAIPYRHIFSSDECASDAKVFYDISCHMCVSITDCVTGWQM